MVCMAPSFSAGGRYGHRATNKLLSLLLEQCSCHKKVNQSEEKSVLRAFKIPKNKK